MASRAARTEIAESRPRSEESSCAIPSPPKSHPLLAESARQSFIRLTLGPRNLHILLVEDNVLNQRVLCKQLRKAGCTVHVANHGGEAIEFLPRTQRWVRGEDHMEPALEVNIILMDWEMPVMDGLRARNTLES